MKTTVRESCKCGATFSIDATPVTATTAASEFREAHEACRSHPAFGGEELLSAIPAVASGRTPPRRSEVDATGRPWPPPYKGREPQRPRWYDRFVSDYSDW